MVFSIFHAMCFLASAIDVLLPSPCHKKHISATVQFIWGVLLPPRRILEILYVLYLAYTDQARSLCQSFQISLQILQNVLYLYEVIEQNCIIPNLCIIAKLVAVESRTSGF